MLHRLGNHLWMLWVDLASFRTLLSATRDGISPIR
jgi:hypothetical protein